MKNDKIVSEKELKKHIKSMSDHKIHYGGYGKKKFDEVTKNNGL